MQLAQARPTPQASSRPAGARRAESQEPGSAPRLALALAGLLREARFELAERRRRLRARARARH